MTNSRTTRGSLQPAKIFKVDAFGHHPIGQPVVCMFNPYEYKVTKSNSYTQKGANSTVVELTSSNPQTLSLTLLFDTFESGTDVSLVTRRLWQFMEPEKEDNKDKKPRAAFVAFKWGPFSFVSVITNMTQTFTLFDEGGMPVRARVDITFSQYKDEDDYKNQRQNPTSGGAPIERVWTVVQGQRLDNIAAAVYGDATEWPKIARFNQISNPFSLEPGRKLVIPQ